MKLLVLLILAIISVALSGKPCPPKHKQLHHRKKGHKKHDPKHKKLHKGKGHGSHHGKGKGHHGKHAKKPQAVTPMKHDAFLEVMTSKPDPVCKTGVLSLDGNVCCSHFCGECSDYPTCSSVRGQNSEGQCCKTKIEELECGGGQASANECLKKCSKTNPPCIMDKVVVQPQTTRNAADDCGEGAAAIHTWRQTAGAAIGQPMHPPGPVNPLYYYYYYYYYWYEYYAGYWSFHVEKGTDRAIANSWDGQTSKYQGQATIHNENHWSNSGFLYYK